MSDDYDFNELFGFEDIEDGYMDIPNEYQPLLATWLLKIALYLKWYQPKRSSRSVPEIFTDSDFCNVSGIKMIHSFEEEERTKSSRRHKQQDVFPELKTNFKKILLTKLQSIRNKKLFSETVLFQNINLLSDLITLEPVDKVLLTFASALELFQPFRDAISSQRTRVSNQLLCQLLSYLSGIPEHEFRTAIGENGILVTTGIVEVKHSTRDLEDKIDLMDGFTTVLLTPHTSRDELVSKFIKKAPAPTLTLDNFPHLLSDTETILPYIKNAVSEKTEGANILFWGKPGVGKSEYVQSLTAALGMDLYEISFADEDGNQIKGEGRLRAYSLCQRLLARSKNSLLMFDEIEDVFPSNGSAFIRMLFGEKNSRGGTTGKAFINRTLETNAVPALWISNSISQIDPAYLRRFDYSVAFPIPPTPIRLSIAEHHLACFNPPEGFLARIAANEETTPAQLDRAAKVARLASNGDLQKSIYLIEKTLDKSASLLNQKRMPTRNILRTGYCLEYLNTDADINAIVTGLKRKPRGTFCFYGTAGTGKSELARYLSDETGKQLHIKRASDIIDKYVGETEKNIAAIFADARQQDAILVLDEADSFLANRQDAQRSWEVTQVNELLTQMESFEGVFICTTNLMDKLDPACLRRFAFKIRFEALMPEQRWQMFQNELHRLGGGNESALEYKTEVKSLDALTPGDFAVAARQFELWDTAVTAEKLFQQLKKECVAKGSVRRKIGFGV